MMNYVVIGTGQLAKVFTDSSISNVCIFASGVSNSGCTDIKQFEREKDLLTNALINNGENKFVYFSSCALSAEEYPKNDYYNHKINMENLIKAHSNNYYIFRLPQLFGDLFLHKTLINFIYKSIDHNHKFKVFDEAYRYVIEINDMKVIVEKYLESSKSNITVDLANPYRYKVIDIVKIFESLMHKHANYEIIERSDQYCLDLSAMEKFISEHDIHVDFGEHYLRNKLEERLSVHG